jgi:hypothetical protein
LHFYFTKKSIWNICNYIIIASIARCELNSNMCVRRWLNQSMINTNRKWILSFGILYLVKLDHSRRYFCITQATRLWMFFFLSVNKNVMKRLIYLKNWQSLDLLVSPLKLSSHNFVDHVAHGFKTKKKKEYKDE